MLEVRQICEQLLTQPGPPPATPQEMLGLAQRDRRRRRGFAAGGATLLIVAASVLTAAWVTPADPPAPPAASAGPSPSPTRRFQLANSPMNERMMAALEAALPPGIAIESYSGGKSEDNSPGTMLSWDVSVSFSRTRYITIDVFRRPEMPIDPRHRANPCRIELMKTFYRKPAQQCEVIAIGQQRIAAGVYDDGDGETWFALRHHGDWTIKLIQRGGAVLSPNEMAALLSNTAFEPD